MSALEEYRRKHNLAVCVDSDGCAMDTMNIKHIRCFGPCMVREWGLEAWEEEILSRWNEINLYTATRGINRFKGLAVMLREVSERYVRIDGIEALEDFAEHAPELSNDAVSAKAGENGIFAKALRWSIAVNEAIGALPEDEVGPYRNVDKALAAAHERADVSVVSSANPEAVRAEWTRFGLLKDVDLICTQEMGSKAYCIGELVKKGYAPDHVLMCGDAPGDEKAADTNGVLYYPILVNHENESWEEFLEEALPRFFAGEYAGEYQRKVRDAFRRNLGME